MLKKLIIFILITISIFAYDIGKKIDFRTTSDDNISSAFIKLSKVTNGDIMFTFDKKVNLNASVNLVFKNTAFIDVLSALTKQSFLTYEKISENVYLVYNFNDPDYAYFSKEYTNILEPEKLIDYLKEQQPTLEISKSKFINNVLVKARQSDFIKIDKMVESFNKYSSENSNLFMNKYYEFDYQKAEEILPILTEFHAFNNIIIDKINNSVYLRFLKSEEPKVDQIIKLVDREKSTVLIEIQVLEYNKNIDKKLGFRWGEKNSIGVKNASNLFKGMVEGNLGSAFSYLVPSQFEFTEIMANSKALATPKLFVLDNSTASINVGEQIPIITAVQRSEQSTQLIPQVEYKSVGLNLAIKPKIHNSNDKISMDLKLAVNSIGEPLATEFGNYYSILTKEIQTQLLLNNDTSIFIGGLIKNDIRKKTISVPLLGKIPVLGRLFRYEETTPIDTEIILYVKPIIISKSDMTYKTFASNNDKKEQIEVKDISEKPKTEIVNMITVSQPRQEPQTLKITPVSLEESEVIVGETEIKETEEIIVLDKTKQ